MHVSSGHVGADRATLAALTTGATVVLLMAVSALPEICAAAVEAGVDPDLPVAMVEQGSTDRERVTHATVGTAAGVAEREGVRPPAVVVIGLVAAEGFLDDPVCATTGPGAESAHDVGRRGTVTS